MDLPSYYFLPKELILEILPRLPVRSLFRFRCVSKPWRSIISDPKFSLTCPRNRFFILSKGLYCFNSIDNHTFSLSEFPKLYFFITIWGSCNGLLLCQGRESKIFYLWNPSTRQSIKVNDFLLYPYDELGLCYDSSTDDYKAVELTRAVEVTGEVVSITSFKNKRQSKVLFPYDDGRIQCSGPVVNQRLHWLVRRRSGDVSPIHNIFEFNPLTDKFTEVPTPMPHNGSKANTILGIGVVDECLCMVRDHSENKIELLVMKEYGIVESWTSQFIMSKNFIGIKNNLMPIYSTKNGEILMKINDEKIALYNPKEKSYREIENPENHYYIHVAAYVESLVSPSAYIGNQDRGKAKVRLIEGGDMNGHNDESSSESNYDESDNENYCWFDSEKEDMLNWEEEYLKKQKTQIKNRIWS